MVANPTAGSGSAGRRLPEILQLLEKAGAKAESALTQAPGDAARLVKEAGKEVDCVAIVGGDGTLNEAVQAFVGPDGEPVRGPVLGIIPSGTGGDFRKTFGLSSSIPEAVNRLMSSPPRPVDLGILELTRPNQTKAIRAFLNITSFGMAGLTDQIVSRGPKWMGGRVTFFLGALRAWAVYRNAPVRVWADGSVFWEGPIVNVAIANGRYFGGGMKIAPDADPHDGLFDVVALCDLSRTQGLALSHRLYLGTHLEHDRVLVTRAKEVRAESLASSTDVLIDMDGETPGKLPLSARVAASALQIRI